MNYSNFHLVQQRYLFDGKLEYNNDRTARFFGLGATSREQDETNYTLREVHGRFTLGRWVRPALVGTFVLYLSCVYAGQVFMNFQWDQLLLEAGFLAIFLTAGSRIVVWLYRWLVFRFLFLAGAMKLVSRRGAT